MSNRRSHKDSPVTELWQVINGRQPGREHARQVTLFDSVGFALEDYSALRYVLDVATALEVGNELELVPVLADPKNLFARLAQQPAVPQKKRA